MTANWFEEYQRLSQKTLFLSKLGAFFLSLFAFLNLWKMFVSISYNPNLLNEIWNNILVSIICHIIVGLIFAVEFILLFFKSKLSFFFTQIIWIVSIFSIFGFFTASRFALYGSYFKPVSSIDLGFNDYPVIFLHASNIFTFFTCVYFILSPIRKIVTAVIALNKIK